MRSNMPEPQTVGISLSVGSPHEIFSRAADSDGVGAIPAAVERVRRPAAVLLGIGLLTALVGIGLAFWSGRMLVQASGASAGPQTSSVGGMTWTVTITGPPER